MRDRDTSRDTATMTPLSRELQKKYKEQGYDMCLKLILWGTPYKDSRPKINRMTLGVSNKNMSEMKVSFGRFYKSCPLLQQTTIMSPYHMEFRAYILATVQERRYFKKEATKRERELYERERMVQLGIQDVDNMLKIHNDILFEPEFRILLDDAWNVGFHEPIKYLVDSKERERVEVSIFYCSKPTRYFQWKMQQNWHVRAWEYGVKHMEMHHRTPAQQFQYLRKKLQAELKTCKNDSEVRELIKKISGQLEKEYPAILLKELSDLELSNRYNRFDSMYKLMTLLVRGHKIAEQIVERGGTRL